MQARKAITPMPTAYWQAELFWLKMHLASALDGVLMYPSVVMQPNTTMANNYRETEQKVTQENFKEREVIGFSSWNRKTCAAEMQNLLK